ncbi:hypothetical protein [Nostoc sp.]
MQFIKVYLLVMIVFPITRSHPLIMRSRSPPERAATVIKNL